MVEIDLKQYGITGVTEIVRNPSYEMLFKEDGRGAVGVLQHEMGLHEVFFIPCVGDADTEGVD